MIRVLYVINNLGVGGAEHVLLDLAASLDRAQFRPLVIAIGDDLALAPRFRELGVPVESLGIEFKADPRTVSLLSAKCRAFRPEILHGFLWRANILCRLAGRSCGVRGVVTSEHSMHVDGPLRNAINRWTAPLSSRIVCVSGAVRDHMISEVGAPPELLQVIYNGVDLDRFAPVENRAELRRSLGLPTDRPIVGAVARHTEEKRLDRFVEAARIVAEQRPDALFLTAGAGPTLHRIRDLAEGYGLDFLCLGHRSDVPDVLAALDVFVITSETEGLPVAAVEAMAVELPVVSNIVGGVPEIIRDGVDGILVPMGDVAGVAKGILDLLADESRRRSMAAEARRRARDLASLESVVAQHEQLYRELAEGAD
jgi:glycosyltransferase involved in cell wall biosynthesis